jgi:hypothetical protein
MALLAQGQQGKSPQGQREGGECQQQITHG